MNLFVWLGVVFCIFQSAMLSGLNLACFTISRLELRIEVAKKNKHAGRVLFLRQDSNFLLVTILWANVAVNVLLALLSGSVLAGAAAFLFSTVVITIFGEIIPQAYFSRNALKWASLLSPVLRLHQVLLFPVAKPTALLLDRWLGPEAISYFKEKDIRELIKVHMMSSQTDIERIEGQSALNFLELDDVPLSEEGEPLDPDSIVPLPFHQGKPVFPEIRADRSDEFLKRIHVCGKKWIVLVDAEQEPGMVVDSEEFIRGALFDHEPWNPYRHCHRPIVVRSHRATIGEIISLLKVKPEHSQDDVVDHDVILLWSEQKRVVTGADVLGRLLRGIVQNPVVGASDRAAEIGQVWEGGNRR